MSSRTIIKVQNLGKRYTLGPREPYYALRDTIVDLLKNRRQRSSSETQRALWALEDVSFEVQEGEALGIIGRNGAGKSTLLKVLSRITPPTTGRATLYGRTSALLEVGTGFHPELTGRENIYLNGAILGMSRAEVVRKFDDIVEFAEIEKFLDTPLKHYSSGMSVRLAFAVAAHLEPEILIVDEVLAVGDAQFQKKCLGKMHDVTSHGRTILFVSHNMSAIAQLCPRAILLHLGQLVADGPAAETIDRYLNLGTTSQGVLDLTNTSLRHSSLENSAMKWASLALVNSRGQITDHVAFREPFRLVLTARVTRLVSDVRLGMAVQSGLGFPIFNSFQTECGLPTAYLPGEYTFSVGLDPNWLAPGLYEVGLGANGPGVIDWIPNAAQFHIASIGTDPSVVWETSKGGVIAYPATWSLDHR